MLAVIIIILSQIIWFQDLFKKTLMDLVTSLIKKCFFLYYPIASLQGRPEEIALEYVTNIYFLFLCLFVGCTLAETQDGYVSFSNLAVLISGSNWHFIFTVTSPPGNFNTVCVYYLFLLLFFFKQALLYNRNSSYYK